MDLHISQKRSNSDRLYKLLPAGIHQASDGCEESSVLFLFQVVQHLLEKETVL